MRKMLTCLLALTLAFPALAAAEALLADGDYRYVLREDGGAEILEFTGSDEDPLLVIPDTLGGVPVTAVGDEVFAYWHFKSVTVPEGVTVLGSRAFCNCYELTEILLPESLTVIGDYAFADCLNLTEIKVPVSVTVLGENAFDRCESLTVLVQAGSYAEQYCQENGIPCRTVDAE